MRVPPSLMGQDKHMCKNTIFFPINNSFFNTKPPFSVPYCRVRGPNRPPRLAKVAFASYTATSVFYFYPLNKKNTYR